METKGSVNAMAINILVAFGSFKRLQAINLLLIMVIKIRKVLMIRMMLVALVNIRILLPFASATNFDMAMGRARVDIVSNNEYVGIAIEYRLIPYVPMIRV